MTGKTASSHLGVGTVVLEDASTIWSRMLSAVANSSGGFARTSGSVWILLVCGAVGAAGCQTLPDWPLIPGSSASPLKADRHLSHALEDYRAGNLEEALESARRAREANPRLTTAAQLEAQLYADLGHREDYIEALRQFAAANPESPLVQCAAGRLLIAAGRRDEGLAALQRAVQLAPHQTEYARELAGAHLAAGDLATAAAVLTAARIQNPTDPTLPVALARLHETAGNWPHALQYYTELLRDEPRNAVWRRHCARCLYRLEQYPQAVAEFQRCMETDVASLSASDRIEFGDACLRTGDLTRAQWLFDQLAAEGVDSRQLAALRGICALRSDRPEAARQIFESALRRWPDDPTLRMLLDNTRQSASGVIPASGTRTVP